MQISLAPTPQTLRALPSAILDAAAPIADWLATPLAALSDAALIETAIAVIERPKAKAKRTSFLLHAPLELLARAALLPRVSAVAREPARRRIAELAVRYAEAGDEVDAPPSQFATVKDAWAALSTAHADGERTSVDAAIQQLIRSSPIDSIARRLFNAIFTSRAAAGHAPILLGELQRVAGRFSNVGLLLRAPLGYLADQPNADLLWAASWQPPKASSLNELDALWLALAKPEAIPVAETTINTELLAPQTLGRYERDLSQFNFNDTDAITKTLLRIAAHSMLQDDPAEAPYGWTHAMTLPLALLSQVSQVSQVSQADQPSRVCAMATAEIYAFRATLGKVSLNPQWKPEPPHHREWIAATPTEAASIAFHSSPSEHQALRTRLASEAAVHRDAHLVKYTVACFDAAALDPECEALYLAAAAYLSAWWRAFDARRG